MTTHPASIIKIAFVCLLFSAAASFAADGPPAWAYGIPAASAHPPAQAPRAAPDQSPKHLAGSSSEFTRAQIGDRFGPADWYPGDHPAMPDVVSHGRKPDVWACALCHYPNGKGRPENAGVSGLPVSYFVHQMHDFRDGLRKSADPNKKNTNLMITYAKAMTEDEIKAAAEYFGSMKWTPWINVVESAKVPKTRLAGGMFLALPGNEQEPLGQRIIEMPVNVEATEQLRDPRSGFIAYVPPGSIKRGKSLVTAGAGKTVACTVCHGADLKGMGPVPGIAGRSPSYLVRQLYDIQQNDRKGEWTSLMKAAVERLSQDDMVNIAAYVSSREP